MKSLMITLSLTLATLSAPAMALGIPDTNLTPLLTFPDQSADQVTQDKSVIRK